MEPARATMHETATIRPASEKDAELIQAMAERIWPLCFATILTPMQIANMLAHIYSVESLHRQMAEGHRFWIASENGRHVGYVSTYKEKQTIWLRKLYVETVAQGKGTGRRMMETAIAEFLPAEQIKLLVNCDNIAAQAFYERNGFSRTGETQVKMGDYFFTDYVYRKSVNQV
jgi:ribosomal protein S18 acetylase RimI-like enzyme